MIYKTQNRKLKIEKTRNAQKIQGELRCSGRVSSFFSGRGTRHATDKLYCIKLFPVHNGQFWTIYVQLCSYFLLVYICE